MLVDGNGKPQIPARIVLGSIVFFIIVVFCYGCYHSQAKAVEDNMSDIVYVRIASGMTTEDVADVLQKQKIISSKYKFILLTKINGMDGKFKIGTYALMPGMDIRDILSKLVEGSTSVVRFTIPEGYDVRQIAARLDKEGIISEQAFLQAAKSFIPIKDFPYSEGIKYKAEGFLFPDTYEVADDVDADYILQMMSDNFAKHINYDMQQKASTMNLSIYDLITLASLVEKEARFSEDRPIIAQVFFKRLRLGMPLQSDATLQYIMRETKEDVSIQDTKISSPYNTYEHRGLPPGPIACPGMAAIEAVLDPADTDYLYFVADRQGHNHYAQTYDEHLHLVDMVR